MTFRNLCASVCRSRSSWLVSLSTATFSMMSSRASIRSAKRLSHRSSADGRCDSVRMGQYCQHGTRLAIKISVAKTLDLRRGIATNELSGLQSVCLWRRFFGHSLMPCRRFARLYRLLPKQDILISRVLHPFGDPRLAFFNRGKTTCGFLPTDPISPSTGALKRRDPHFDTAQYRRAPSFRQTGHENIVGK